MAKGAKTIIANGDEALRSFTRRLAVVKVKRMYTSSLVKLSKGYVQCSFAELPRILKCTASSPFGSIKLVRI